MIKFFELGFCNFLFFFRNSETPFFDGRELVAGSIDDSIYVYDVEANIYPDHRFDVEAN